MSPNLSAFTETDLQQPTAGRSLILSQIVPFQMQSLDRPSKLKLLRQENAKWISSKDNSQDQEILKIKNSSVLRPVKMAKNYDQSFSLFLWQG